MNAEKKKNILIVDDDPFLQTLYRRTLEREGFNILTAVDGLEAMEMLPKVNADLVVLDLMLPKRHGFEVLETIRSSSQHKNLPVLILSNAYLPDTAQRAMKAAATAGMLKSECSPKQLVKIIRETLQPVVAKLETPPAAKTSWFSSLLGGKAGNSGPAAGETSAESTGTATSQADVAGSASTLEVQNELLKSWPTDIATIREIGLKYVKTVGVKESEEHLKNVYRRLRLLGARATIGELSGISQLSNALEAMLFEHGFNIKKTMSPSVLQTMVQAVDCIEYLFKTGRTTSRLIRENRILLVDDDPVCNLANQLALKRANFETVCVGDGGSALTQLQNRDFDLILLDVNMPEMNGFEVCKKIRQLPRYKDVPVIFVTINDDFQSRAQSVLSGSNGLITKPISPLELIVKSLVFLLRSGGGNVAAGMSLAGQSAGTSRAVTGDQTQQPAVAALKNEGRVKELKATQAAVEDRVKALTEALTTETKQREEAEQQAAATVKLQSKLEMAKVNNQNAHEHFGRMLEESKQQAQNSQGNEAWKLEGRNRALESVRNFVEDKVRNLKDVLEVQAKKSEAAQQRVAEYAKRKVEMETALAEIQQAKDNLMKEIEAAGNGKLRGDLEAALAKNERSQAELLQKLESSRQKFELQQQDQNTGPGKSGGQKPDAASEAQVKALNAALAAEKKRCADAEQQAAEISQRRGDLEAELIQSNRAQEQLRNALAEQQQRLAEQVQTQNVEAGSIADRTKELAAAQTALAELKAQHVSVAGQVQTLTKELSDETGRRATVEQQTSELQARRAELEKELVARTQAQEQLRTELAGKQRLLDEQVQSQNVHSGNVTEQAKELATARAALAELQARHENATGQVQTLTESLTAESGRRATVEQQTAELMARRTELEKELAGRTQTQEQLRAELAEKQRLLDAQVQTHNAELSTRTQALEGDRSAVEAKVSELTKALAAERERCEMAERQAAGVGLQRGTLEAELTQSRQMQEQLRAQLAEQQQCLDAQVQTHNVELGNFSERVKELEAAQAALAEMKAHHAGVTQQVQVLTESLTAESGRRANAEQTAAGLVAHRADLEKELAQRTQMQEQLRAELAEQQQRLGEQVQTHKVELGNFNGRLHELESTQAALADLKVQHQNVAGQVQALTASLKSEWDRRAAAEQTAAELVARRAELEKELAQRTQTQEQLRAELAGQQQRLDAQVQSHHVELENFGARVKELESTRNALTELKTQHAGVTGQVRSLTETLAAESGRRKSAEKQSAELVVRRTELERELAQGTQEQEQLRVELIDQQQHLEAEVQTHHLEVKKFEARVQDLATAQAALAELKAQHTGVNQQVQSLNKSLTTESGRREDAEKQVAKLISQRIEMEHDITLRTQAHQQLRAELAIQQQRLETEVQAHGAQQGKLAERTKELEAAQTALTESLKTETGRRALAEQMSAQQASRRAELEKELTQRTQTQEQLRAELAEKQHRLEAQVSTHNVELGKLTERTKELEAAQAALAGLKSQHTAATEQVKLLTAQAQSLTESLQAESGRRTAAEQEAAKLAAHRAELEQELAQRTQTQEQLRTELTEHQQRLAARVEAHQLEVEKHETRVKELTAVQGTLTELQTQHAGVTEQVRSLTESLKTETGRREDFELQVVCLTTHRAELEQGIVQHTQVQQQMRAELVEQQQRLNAQVQAHNVELGNLAERTQELAVAQTALAELKSQHAGVTERAQSLAESLAGEAGRREAAEKNLTELHARRTELEKELSQRTQTQEQLQVELSEKQRRMDAIAAELAGVRHRAEAEAGQLAGQLSQAEQGRMELGRQLSGAQELTATREATIRSLESELQRQRGEHDRVDGLYQAETAHRSLLEAQIERVQAQLDETSGNLAKKRAAELVWLRRESELQECIRNQRAEIEKSSATQAAQAVEIESARTKITDFETHHSALVGKIQALTGQTQTLTESLTTESARRTTIEKQTAELTARRTELEQELAQRTQGLNQLRADLTEKQQRLDERVLAHNAEMANLAVRTQELAVAQTVLAELRTQHASVTEKARSLAESLVAESGQRETAEKSLAELHVRRTELEQEVASRAQAQEQLRTQLAGQAQAYEAEVANLAARTKELTTTQAELAELKTQHANVTVQAQALTASLAAETSRREVVEQQLAELQARRVALEQEVARRVQAQEQLHVQLAERVQAHNLEIANLAARTQELAATQASLTELQARHTDATGQVQLLTASLAAESGRREMAQKNFAELIVRRTELEQEVVKHSETQAQLRVQLAEQVQAHNVEIVNLTVRTQELAATQTALTEWQARHADATGQVRSLTASLADTTSRHTMVEQGWRERESDLQGRLQSQQDALVKSSAIVAGQEIAIKNTRKELEELLVLQSALCAKVQHLTREGEAAAKFIQELKAKVVHSENAVENGAKEMAGMRYAILDAARMNVRLHRERLQKERQSQEVMRRLLSSLAQTPLSLAQHGILTELQHSVDSLKNNRAGGLHSSGYPVEPPSLRGSEFSFAEITESVFQAVRTAATAAGVTVQVSASGTTPRQLIGCAEHVHQLISLLAISPLTIMTGVHALDLRVAIKPTCERFAEINLRVALSTADDGQELRQRLASVTAAATTLQTGSFNESEIGLAAGWQLAAALGAQPGLEMEGGQEVCLMLSLPIEMNPQLASAPDSDAVVYAPVLNGDGNDHGHSERNGRNGHHHHDGNGYDFNGARTGTVVPETV